MSKTRFLNIFMLWEERRSCLCQWCKRVLTKIKFLLSGIFIALAAICVVAQTAYWGCSCGLSFSLNSVAASIIGGLSFSGGRGALLDRLWEINSWTSHKCSLFCQYNLFLSGIYERYYNYFLPCGWSYSKIPESPFTLKRGQINNEQ